MRMKQVIKHRDGGLPNMIRRTDPDDNSEISSSNQVKVSNIVNTSLLIMSTTGIGSIIATSYLFMDIGVTYYTGHNLDNYINNVSDSFWGTNKGVVYDFR